MNNIDKNIVCMKWGNKFHYDYVNRLYKSVKKNLTLNHRFICFTDNTTGLDKNIETFPLPEITIINGEPERGWRKLGILKNNLANITGQVLFLDLDIIILNNIDCFFEDKKEFMIIKDWDFKNYIGNSSVFRFEVNKHENIISNFEKNREQIKKQFRNEQAYLSFEIKNKNMLNYWNKKWCVSFKRNCLRFFPINYFIEAKKPKNAKILVFHGHPNPMEAINGYKGKYGFRYVKPTSWLKEYIKI